MDPLQHADGSRAPRTEHALVALGEGELLVFGGQREGQLLQEPCILVAGTKVGGWRRVVVGGCLMHDAPRVAMGTGLSRRVMLHPLQTHPQHWVEPAVRGEMPRARKGAAASASQGGRFVVLFGGAALGEGGEEEVLSDAHIFELEGGARPSLLCHPLAPAGELPQPRKGAMLQVGGQMSGCA